MSKFTCKNDTLDLLQFTGVVEKSLIPLFLQLTVKYWSCLCDQPSECLGYPDPGPHVQASCVLTGWQLSLLCPWFLQHGQTYSNLSQWQLLPQHNSNKYRASVTWDPQDVYVLLYMCHANQQNLLPWKTVCAMYYPKVCGLISPSRSMYKGASVNIAQDSTLCLHSSRAAVI